MKIMIPEWADPPAGPFAAIMGSGGCKAMPGALPNRRLSMWTKPEYTEMRFGFEVTMYIANR